MAPLPAQQYPGALVRGAFRAREQSGARIGIVALARKLLIALWRYLETGVVPEGAVLKA